MGQKHTPLPYFINSGEDYIDIASDRKFDADKIISQCGHPDIAENLANAEFIVQCVNSHYKLLAASKVALDFLSTSKIIHNDAEYIQVDDIIDQLTPAITEAEGK